VSQPARPGGYRQPSPDPAALVQWPDAFGTRALVCVDTEEEFDWSRPLSRNDHATTTLAALPEGQRRLIEIGFLPGFFCSYPVVSTPANAAIVRTLLDRPGAAIGAQLHAWVTPPFDEEVSPFNSFAGNLSASLEAAKLDALTTAIAQATGARPRAYRAGRYGIGPDTLALLAARGYRLDSSIRARHEYVSEGGPDFRALGNDAFIADGVVCLPLTTVFTGRARRQGSRLYQALSRLPKGRGIAARSGLLSRVALTPEGMPFPNAAEAVRVAVGEGVRVLNFAFHSPSLVPGHTPYTRDAGDLAAFWRWWDAMSLLLTRLGVRAIGLDELIAAADQALNKSRSAASTI
jgi:hypothetical protein